MSTNKYRDSQHGIAHLLVIVLIVVTIIGFVGYKVLHTDKTASQNNNSQPQTSAITQPDKNGPPTWEYDMKKLAWFVKSGKATQCKDPLKFDRSPVDMSKVSAVGLPGAYRGYNYKAHGGMRLTDSTNGNVEVRLPMDTTLRSIKRYYESVPNSTDEQQYLIDFESDCGIAIRFDHILTLTPALQALAEKTPAPKKNDTSGDPNANRLNVPMKSGEVIATAVGFPKIKNYGFDFGVYDYRQRNEISRNSAWAAIHQPFSASTFHGVCWVTMLPPADAAAAEAMSKDRTRYNSSKPFNLTSDYCTFAPHKTLEFNNGQPTDG